MRPLDYFFVIAFFCLVVYFAWTFVRALAGYFGSFKRLIDGAASKLHAHSIKPGTFNSTRLTKQKSPKVTSADAVAKEERPMAVRVLPAARNWDLYETPTYQRREIQLSI